MPKSFRTYFFEYLDVSHFSREDYVAFPQLYLFQSQGNVLYCCLPINRQNLCSGLTTEVVIHNVFFLNAKVCQHVDYSLAHRTRTAHIVFYIFGCFVIF